MHHHQVLTRAAENVAAGDLSMRLDPIAYAVKQLGGGPDVLQAAYIAVSRELGCEAGPEWTDRMAGRTSPQVAAVLAMTAAKNPQKELTA